MLVRICRKGNPNALMVRLQIGTATMEISIEVYQKIKSRTTTRPSNSTFGYLTEETQDTDLKRSCTPVFIAALFTMAKIMEASQVSINR